MSTTHDHPNQFALLSQRRFAPFFFTQFLGAGNDNLFKFAFTVLVTYQIDVEWMKPNMAGLVIGAVFILPFLLFSATSGQLTDKYDKTRVIQLVKSLEIAIMLLAAWGFWASHVPVLLACEADPALARRVREHLGEQGVPAGIVADILADVRAAGGVERARQKAAALAEEAVAALAELPASRYRDGLVALAHASADRSS